MGVYVWTIAQGQVSFLYEFPLCGSNLFHTEQVSLEMSGISCYESIPGTAESQEMWAVACWNERIIHSCRKHSNQMDCPSQEKWASWVRIIQHIYKGRFHWSSPIFFLAPDMSNSAICQMVRWGEGRACGCDMWQSEVNWPLWELEWDFHIKLCESHFTYTIELKERLCKQIQTNWLPSENQQPSSDF